MLTEVREPLPVTLNTMAPQVTCEEDNFAPSLVENPLEVDPLPGEQTFSAVERQGSAKPGKVQHEHGETPPPYSEVEYPHAQTSSIIPVELSAYNDPQVVTLYGIEPFELFNHTAAISSQSTQLGSPVDASLVPAPLRLQQSPSNAQTSRKPVPSQALHIVSSYSLAKSHKADFEKATHNSVPLPGPGSVGGSPDITVLSLKNKLKHTRGLDRATGYLIPFPKPRLNGMRVEDIPERFLIYTPPLPPLSKPAPGEKETHWHKSQRQWQDDVRKATLSKASRVTWKGMKAATTNLIHKGMNMTRSSNVEFLDRVSGGTITSVGEDLDDTDENASKGSSKIFSSRDDDKYQQSKSLKALTLIYPPSLSLTPEQIRTEFVDSLVRTREKSRNQAFIASALLPVAAAVDASLIVTLGGFTQVSGIWAYTSTSSFISSKKITKGLTQGKHQAPKYEEHRTETGGCTCGHHESDPRHEEMTVKAERTDNAKTVAMELQASAKIETLRRYLNLACLEKEFGMFPQIQEDTGDVNEDSVIEAIGWTPTRRCGRDLDVEFKDRVETLTCEEDERYQLIEVKEDVKRIMRKAATEWVTWCKAFQKDPETALKR